MELEKYYFKTIQSMYALQAKSDTQIEYKGYVIDLRKGFWLVDNGESIQVIPNESFERKYKKFVDGVIVDKAVLVKQK